MKMFAKHACNGHPITTSFASPRGVPWGMAASLGASSLGASEAKVPFFVHIHKAGGTSVCSLARRVLNGTAARPSTHWNCNSLELQPAFQLRGFRAVSDLEYTTCPKCCESAASTVRLFKLALVAWEAPIGQRWLPPAALQCHRHFSYGIVLRSPLERIASWLHETLRIRKLDFSPQDLASTCSNGTMHQFLATLSPADISMLDNSMTRALTGLNPHPPAQGGPPARYFLGPAQVRSAHAHLASRALRQFDVVVDIASLNAASFRGWGWHSDERVVWRRPTITGKQSAVGSARTGSLGVDVAMLRADGMPSGMLRHEQMARNATHRVDSLYPLTLWPGLAECLRELNAPDEELYRAWRT